MQGLGKATPLQPTIYQSARLRRKEGTKCCRFLVCAKRTSTHPNQVASFLNDHQEIGRWRQAQSSISVQEGQPATKLLILQFIICLHGSKFLRKFSPFATSTFTLSAYRDHPPQRSAAENACGLSGPFSGRQICSVSGEFRRFRLVCRVSIKAVSLPARIKAWHSNLTPLASRLPSSPSVLAKARFWHSMAPALMASAETPVRMLPSLPMSWKYVGGGRPCSQSELSAGDNIEGAGQKTESAFTWGCFR